MLTHFSALVICALHPRPTHRLCELAKLQSSCKKLNLLSELMDHSGNYVHTVLPYILSLLQQGLGQRIHLLTHSLTPDPEVGKIYIQGLQSSTSRLLSWQNMHTDFSVLNFLVSPSYLYKGASQI